VSNENVLKTVLGGLLLLTLVPAVQAQQDTGLESNATTIIEKRCLSCHNSELKTSGLDLSSRETAIQGGKNGAALVPGRPDASLMFRKISAGQMPPGNPLPDDERESILNWIKAGSPWTVKSGKIPSSRPRAGLDWWSLQPLKRVSIPNAEGLPEDWSHSPIDSFVYAKMKEKGIQPSLPADRRTYIRRATFDLLGLPPTPEEVKNFVEDRSEHAYEKLIDRLLASPHYGERWGRHWLDVVRFGESNGYEQNHLRNNAWPYRDYVIESFNQDKPFTRMIQEQLAGDQLAPEDPGIAIATGFLVAGPHDTVPIENVEGALQQRANDLDDMVLTTGAAFLGLTVNCARCHDHKFDPIQQADYYRLRAAFAGVQHRERELATRSERERRKAKEEPILEELEQVKQRIAGLKTRAQPLVDQNREKIENRYRPPVDAKINEEKFSPVLARFVRMTILATSKNEDPALDELEVWSEGPSSENVALASRGTKARARTTRTADGADASFYKPGFLNDGKFDETWISGEFETGEVTLEFPKDQTISKITWSRDRLGANQGRFLNRIPVRYLFEISVDGTRWQKVADSGDRLPYLDEERQELFLLSVLSSGEQEEWKALKRRRLQLEKDLAGLSALPVAYIGSFSQPKEATYVEKRGNPMDKGEAVSPESLSTLQKMLPGFKLDMNAPEGERRLALARWLSNDQNALTARVLANRIWHYHFGKGLVGTPSDFGFNGERPTHPQLLDWLAFRLQSLGWRLKPFHKELMLSATYRQSSASNTACASIDSESRYLWRFPPRRLEAEAIRDAVLAASGKLDLRMGGPGFQLYKYTVDNVATYQQREGFDTQTYRRAVYHQAARSVKDDFMGPYDCPDSALPEPKRVITTTALQALSLLNNSFMVDQSRFFAERLVREAGKDPAAQVVLAFQIAFGRAPKEQELAAATDLIRHQGLNIFCRALLNANEFVYVM
jgi:Protein of unknown function (DUF1549)/Protein of unknown function (DUF1553)/Planctomycete cytochrome C